MGSCGVDACLFVQIWLDLCNIYSMQQFNNNNKLAINNLGKGPKRKKSDFYHLGSWPPPLESDKKISIFLDTRPLGKGSKIKKKKILEFSRFSGWVGLKKSIFQIKKKIWSQNA